MDRENGKVLNIGAEASMAGKILLLLCCLLCWPSTASALQVHPSPEGLIVHQLGHLFFVASMAVLAYWLQVNRLAKHRSWRLIQVSCLFFIVWNLCAFIGHCLSQRMTPDMFIGSSNQVSQQLVVNAMPTLGYLYYVFHLDHVFCVPAMVLLYLGVRGFCQLARVKDQDDDG